MFTGLIETTGTVVDVKRDKGNTVFVIESTISDKLSPDESVAHDGVCLTITQCQGNQHVVIAIPETLKKTNLGQRKPGDLMNLERALSLQDRLGGHFVQGHVDTVAICTEKKEVNGSWEYVFAYPEDFAAYVIEKGSVCVNGISLTCFDVHPGRFRVAIIPYTYAHTNIRLIEPGHQVNLEFDMLGKYVVALTQQYLTAARL
ncbi:MAG: riboflavin synthase [Thermoflavifilum sp.]|uniref:riboflavin synthase n=1 Tax=Thermoflavifilum sp. TaxID=1968839 RepID=UPI0018A3FF48|nr:riboflavin synthase [Thermoflavifilum sp.]QOR76313.1 MAG: riboflavin synthase [Thermoflavifilum sp.]